MPVGEVTKGVAIVDTPTRLRYRLQPIVDQVSAAARVLPPRLHIPRTGGFARIGIDENDGQVYLTYPSRRAAAQSDEEITGVIAHEIAHLALGHVQPETVPRWMRSGGRIVVTMAVAVLAAVVLVTAIGAWLRVEWLQLTGGDDLNPLPLIIAVLLAGIPLIVYSWTRQGPTRPGWEGTSSRQREIAADVAGVQLVGYGPMLAATSARVPRTWFGRWAARRADGVLSVLASHPSTEFRIQSIEAYRGENPRTYAAART